MKELLRAFALDAIEQKIDRIKPGTVVKVSDLVGESTLLDKNGEISNTTIMLLQKYGIEYIETGQVEVYT